MSAAEDIRANLTDPAGLCRALGLEVSRSKRQARGVFARCPAHNDKDPSCSIRVMNDGTIGAHCFACGWSGDALGLVAAARGLDVRLDFGEVIKEAADIAGVRLEERSRTNSGTTPSCKGDLVEGRPSAIDRIALRIDQAAEDWLHGRQVRPAPEIENATPEQIAEAVELLDLADELTAEMDREFDRATTEWAAAAAVERAKVMQWV